MRWNLKAATISLHVALAGREALATSDGNSPVVQTTSGAVRGFSPVPFVQAFLGVPYAEPPLGSLRFLAPVPIASPRPGIIDATQPAKGCIQVRSASFPWPADSNVTAGESEDCLTVDVWRNTKGRSRKLKPVLVWIYGGGFAEGATSLDLFNPTDLIKNHGEIIFVAVNYRLNIFGYPESSAIPEGHTNAGLRDQRLAIEWVRDNIRSFDGDPSRIVLAGQSAGAFAMYNYLYTYRSDPIITGAIPHSGTAGVGTLAPPGEFQRVAAELGCTQSDASAQLDCLRGKTARELRLAISPKEEIISGVDGNGGYPHFDDETYLRLDQIEAAWAAGEFAKIPLLAGITHNEGDIIDPDPAVSDVMTCSIFDMPLSQQISFYEGHNVPVWRYRFMGNFPALAPPDHPYMRAYHTVDVPLLFGSYKIFAPNAGPDVDRASAYMQRAWAAFVKDPKRGLAKLGWPKVTRPGKNLVELFNRKADGGIDLVRFTDQAVRDAQCQVLTGA